MPHEDSREVRTVTAKIAQGYDLVPYNPKGIGSPGLDPVYVFGLAALYRDFPQSAACDVLDLGCGGGSQLLRAGAQTTGRLVGIDISRAACDEAAVRCAGFGARCSILCSDLFDLDPSSLGQFDLIYMVGVYYVVQPAVQRRLLEVVSACLKPGGVVLISHYAPEIWRHFDVLRRRLHGVTEGALAPAARIAAGRKAVRDIAQTVGQGGIPEQILSHALSCEEATFFHEMLGEILAPVTTQDLENALAPEGIHFLNWMAPGPFAHLDGSPARAAAADRMPGGYHYAVFAKCADAPCAWAGVVWQTRLRRMGASPRGGVAFRDPVTGYSIDIGHPATARALDILPSPWPILAATLKAEPAVRTDFLSLWQNGFLTALGLEKSG